MKKIDKSKLKLISILVGVYLASTAVSYAFFNITSARSSGIDSEKLGSVREKIATEPKTEECPLNGAYFTKTEQQIWSGRRPMGIMIENSLDSRPQSGMSNADIIYEAVAEGGVTRFLAMYHCGAAAENVTVGPIRSSRVYFIDWVSEYGAEPVYVHFGGANNICSNPEDPACTDEGTKQPGVVDPRVMALEELINLGWRHSRGNALDGGANAGAPAIVRDQYRLGDEPAAWEHSAIGSTDLLYNLAIERGFDGRGWDRDFTAWKFADSQPVANPDATEIDFEFWSNKPDYDVSWKYDQDMNSYVRLNGGDPHIDWENKEQLTASNVVVMFVEEEGPVDDELHMYYETLGAGEAIIFQNGTAIEGTWEKPSRTERTKFYDESGKEISFVRGVIWIEAVPRGNEILY